MISADQIHAAAPGPLDVARLLGLRVSRRSRADRAVVSCPWHSPDRSPSCAIALRAGRVVAYCHACHEGGDLLALVAAVRGLDTRADFGAVVREAAELLGVRDDGQQQRSGPPRRRDPAQDLAAAIDRAADDWLSGRSVSRVDVATIEGSTMPVRRQALRLLAAQDEEHARREDAIEWMAQG